MATDRGGPAATGACQRGREGVRALLLGLSEAGLLLIKVPVRKQYMKHHLGPQPQGGKLLRTAKEDCPANQNPHPASSSLPRVPSPSECHSPTLTSRISSPAAFGSLYASSPATFGVTGALTMTLHLSVPTSPSIAHFDSSDGLHISLKRHVM